MSVIPFQQRAERLPRPAPAAWPNNDGIERDDRPMPAPAEDAEPMIGVPASVFSGMLQALAFYAGAPTPGFDDGALARSALFPFQQ